MKIKIGFVIHSLTNGGAERVVATLCNFLSEKYDVVLITLVRRELFHSLEPSIELRCLGDTRHSVNSFSALYNNFQEIRKLRKIIKQDEINILISFTTSSNVLSILASITSKIPCIVSERNNAEIAPPNFFWRLARNTFYRFASSLVVQTEGNKNFYSKIVDETNIKIIQNPISKAVHKTKSFADKNNAGIQILTVGRLNANKAQHLGLEALSKLKKYDWNFTIIGGGPSRIELEKLSKKLGISNRVNFTGAIKNVGDYYQIADVFIFTSRSEGFPNALMEAHYSGIPSISTNCNFGPSDIIRDGEDGFLIPVDNGNVLKEKLELLILNQSLRGKFSKNAKARGCRFELTKIAGIWEKLINETLTN